MLIFSFIVLYIVYANLVRASCSTEELCPEFLNNISANHFYIEFPAARLAFISSGSATVSFALLAILMAIHSYTNAAFFLLASREGRRGPWLSPYELSTLLRVLNAELAVLWHLAFAKVKRIFWDRETDSDSSPKSPSLLRSDVAILLAGLTASLLVQAADVYIHIAAEGVQYVQLEHLPAAGAQFSRGVAPWCINKPKFGDLGEEQLWGCAITAQTAAYNNATSLAATNASIISNMKNNVSDQHNTITFSDADGVQYALVGPANDDATIDWKASSFGVSTACSAIPEGGCAVAQPITNATDRQGNPVMLVPFKCTKAKAGLDITGILTSANTATHTMNFHKYSAESPPFFNSSLVRMNVVIAKNGSENGNDIFKNNWTVLVMRKIPSVVQGDFSQLPPSFSTDTRIWKHGLLGAFVLLHCHITGDDMLALTAVVWDILYKSVASNVTILNKSPSNGSLAGMASMPSTRMVGTLTNIFQDEATGSLSRRSPDNFIQSFELGMSKAYSYPIASQLSGRPSLLMQSRTLKVVTRLPFAALWCLVAANLGYTLLGIGVAVYAMIKVNDEVGQVQIRLGTAGLVAALFTDRARFGRPVTCEEDLFKQQSSEKVEGQGKIGVIKTKDGGSSYIVIN
ncbi:hypothetical protein EK21DRAFT_115877 [Setomelanomma holmii]|uniref:Uncharacterized protein n=1 Tax=Setomelanomma holmii TaxID=210430 RepID=A0A9P4H1Y9_9PLEO|nr:hypothetical protein EK21DRAFT_115877 [Setomelanomma holmii]